MKLYHLCGAIIQNILSDAKINYVVENVPWSIKADGDNITSRLKNNKGRITTTTIGLNRSKIIHYGSFNLFIKKKYFPVRPERIVATCFHLSDGDNRNNQITVVDKKIGKWHTSCQKTKRKLISYGVSEDKIVVIPLGIDTEKYFSVGQEEKEFLRKKYNIPKDTWVIGSFQKDGNGWGEGNDPKLIKGPDVFCDVVEQLAKKEKVFVLLSGPARGYVKKRLEKAGIAYRHFVFENPDDVAELYRLLDIYIVASREEGGPKALLEAMASGIPIISTCVGMAPDIIYNEKNGLLCKVDDTDALTENARRIISDCELRRLLVCEGLKTAKKYDLSAIVKRYEEELYR